MYLETEYSFDHVAARSSELCFVSHLIYTHWHASQTAFFSEVMSMSLKKKMALL